MHVNEIVFSADSQPEQSVVKTQDKNMKTDHQGLAEQELDRIERTLNTVAVGLEILTGICAGVEDDESTEDIQGEEQDVEAEGSSRIFCFNDWKRR